MSNRDELIKQFSLAEEKEKKEKTDDKNNKDKKASTAAAENQAASNSAHHEHGKKKSRSRKKKFAKTVKGVLADKTLNKMLNIFLLCLIANIVEYFVLINYFGIPTRGVASKILGLMILLGYMHLLRLKPHNIGMSINKHAIISAIKNALIFNTAIIPAYIIEYIYFAVKGTRPIIRIFAYQSSLSESGPIFYIANILLLLVIESLSVIMLETLFRGILVKMGKSKFGFWQTTIIISIFYSLWYLIVPLSKISAGYTPVQLIPLCIFYLILEFSLSVKWCMCTRATGSIWLALFDHLFFNTIVNLTHVIQTQNGLLLHTDVNRNYRLIIIQLISCALCFSYYKMKMRKKQQLMQAAGIKSIYAFDSLADMSVEDVSRQAERIKTSDGEIDAHYLQMLEKNNSEHHY